MSRLLVLAVVCLVTLSTFALSTSARAQDGEDGFAPLFDGKSLGDWKGDSRFWRVEDGAIIGETTADNTAEKNTFLILRDQDFANFEIRFSYRVTGFNSGIQYRSKEMDGFVVKGYQADFEARWHDDGKTDKFSGMFFEENGRMFMGQRGEAVIVRTGSGDDGKPEIEKVGTLGDTQELEKSIHRDDWNDYTIIANGYQFTHIINGRVMAIAFDEDTANRAASGIFAFQLHSGPPMKIMIKNIRVRKL